MKKKLMFLMIIPFLLLPVKNFAAKDKDDDDLKDAIEEFKHKLKKKDRPRKRRAEVRVKDGEMQMRAVPHQKEIHRDSFRKQGFQPEYKEEQNFLRNRRDQGWRPRGRDGEDFHGKGERRGPWEIEIKDTFKKDDDKDWRDKGFSRDRLQKREKHWGDRARGFRQRFGEHRKRHHIFDQDFWGRFRSLHRNWFFSNQFSWFGTSSWSVISRWLPWSLNTPILYYFDDSGRVYYALDLNRPYFLPVESSRDLDINILDLVDSRPYFSRDQRDWIPLGTFAVFRDDGASEMPQEYISLAISKDGAVSGAYVNIYDGRPVQIEGAVDKVSQRIAWKFVDQNWPVMETGLYNLTTGQATLLEHSSRYNKEPRVMIRIQM